MNAFVLQIHTGNNPMMPAFTPGKFIKRCYTGDEVIGPPGPHWYAEAVDNLGDATFWSDPKLAAQQGADCLPGGVSCNLCFVRIEMTQEDIVTSKYG